jgi:hypothetical protein
VRAIAGSFPNGSSQGVIGLVADLKVAVGAAEHVFFLCHRPLHIGSARNIGIGHVEDCKALTVLGRQGTGHLAPVAGKHLDLEAGGGMVGLLPPAIKVATGKCVVGVDRVSPLKGREGLPHNSSPPGALMAYEAASLSFFVATERASWHG